MVDKAYEKFKNFSEEEFDEFFKNNWHNEEYDDEYVDGVCHVDWDCDYCDAERVRKKIRSIAESKKTGRLPSLGASSVSGSFTINEVKVGDFANYLSRPGASNYPYEYAECVSVKFDESISKYIVEWRKSNSDEDSFFAVYGKSENLNISRKLK